MESKDTRSLKKVEKTKVEFYSIRNSINKTAEKFGSWENINKKMEGAVTLINKNVKQIYPKTFQKRIKNKYKRYRR